VLALRAALFFAIGVAPNLVFAGENDFRLHAQRNGEGVLYTVQANRFVPLDDAWRSFTTELGYVLAPRLASPAETLGHAGFHLGVMWSGTSVTQNARHWQVTERGQAGNPPGFLSTLQIDARKGLPLSLEIGASLSWLVNSELYAPALEVRWAIHEGFDNAPAVAIRGSVSHLVGNRDMLLTTAGIDAVVSKSFGLLGMLNVAPYASWSVLMIAASSRLIDPTPTIEDDPENNFVFREITPTSRLHHKLTLGVRTLFSFLNVSIQGEFQMLERGLFGTVATLSTKIGLDY
jgi:hypothetical protein